MLSKLNTCLWPLTSRTAPTPRVSALGAKVDAKVRADLSVAAAARRRAAARAQRAALILETLVSFRQKHLPRFCGRYLVKPK